MAYFWTHQDQLYRRESEGVWVMCDLEWKESSISPALSMTIEKEWSEEESRQFEKFGPVGTWDYMKYLADMERIEGGGKEWPRGDLDPCDWKYETGAACLG